MAESSQETSATVKGAARMVTFAAMLGGFTAFLLGLGLIVVGAVCARQNTAVHGWQAVPAQVVSAETVPVHRFVDGYQVKLDYRYQVDGREFTGSEHLPGFLKAQAGAEESAAKCQAEPLEVLVEPAHPEHSTIEDRGILHQGLFFSVVGAFLFFLSFFLLRLVFRRARCG